MTLMKKSIVVTAVIFFLACASGGYWYNLQKKTTPSIEKKKEIVAEGTVAQPSTSVAPTKSTVLRTLKDAMNFGRALQCSSLMDFNGKMSQVTTLVDGSKYRSTVIVGNETATVLFDGTSQYIWKNGVTTGIQMTKECLDKMKNVVQSPAPTTPRSNTGPQDWSQSFDTAQDVKCQAVPPIDFSVPKGVSFKDACASKEKNEEWWP